MGLVSIRHRGDFKRMEKLLTVVKNRSYFNKLDRYGEMGVNALSQATPVRTGKTAASWQYKIERNGSDVKLSWYNTNENGGVNIAVILQYGHGTRNGGYVRGRDYINPAMKPIFDEIANGVWEEVTKS